METKPGGSTFVVLHFLSYECGEVLGQMMLMVPSHSEVLGQLSFSYVGWDLSSFMKMPEMVTQCFQDLVYLTDC